MVNVKKMNLPLPPYLKYPKFSTEQLEHIRFNGKDKRNKFGIKNPVFLQDLLIRLTSKPAQKIIVNESEDEKKISELKSSYLEVFKIMGITKLFKITDSELIYIPNGSAIVFKTSKETLGFNTCLDRRG